MAIRLACPHCGTHIQVNEEWQGKRVRCGGCQKLIDVPGVAPLKISRRQREALQERPARTAPRRPAWDDDLDDDRPVRRAAPRDEAEHDEPEREGKGAPLGLILGIGGGVLALVIFIVVLILVVGKAQDDDNERRLAQANAPPLNPGQLNAAEVNPAPQLNPAPLNVNAEPKRVVNPGPVEPLPNDIAPEVVNRVKNATVYLRVTSPGGQVAEGSGFLAVEPGIVVTNALVLGMLQATSRVPELVPIRYGRMLVSPFAFFRGGPTSWPRISAACRARGSASSSAGTRTWPISAASPHQTGRWCSTSTTSTRRFPALGSGT